MSKSLNSVTISGNLGRDPEVRYFESGNCLAKFSVAVSGREKGQDVTNWINCEAWGKLASDVIANYCKKGSKVGVTGSLKVNTWQERETGKDRSMVIVNVRDVALLDSKQQGQSGQQSSYDDEPLF